MASMQNAIEMEVLRVIHPLKDVPEAKCASEGLGPLAMTASVRVSLIVLRGYLILMSGMLLWHVLELAGWTRALR